MAPQPHPSRKQVGLQYTVLALSRWLMQESRREMMAAWTTVVAVETEKWRDRDSLADGLKEGEGEGQGSVPVCTTLLVWDPGDCARSSLSVSLGKDGMLSISHIPASLQAVQMLGGAGQEGHPRPRTRVTEQPWAPQRQPRPGGLRPSAELSGLRWGVCCPSFLPVGKEGKSLGKMSDRELGSRPGDTIKASGGSGLGWEPLVQRDTTGGPLEPPPSMEPVGSACSLELRDHPRVEAEGKNPLVTLGQ